MSPEGSKPLKNNKPIVFHYRKVGNSNVPQATEGATVVFLPETKKFGIALCCKRDNYSRKLGRRIATARARLNKTPKVRHRFSLSMDYEGPMTLENVRASATSFVRYATATVGNTTSTNV